MNYLLFSENKFSGWVSFDRNIVPLSKYVLGVVIPFEIKGGIGQGDLELAAKSTMHYFFDGAHKDEDIILMLADKIGLDPKKVTFKKA